MGKRIKRCVLAALMCAMLSGVIFMSKREMGSDDINIVKDEQQPEKVGFSGAERKTYEIESTTTSEDAPEVIGSLILQLADQPDRPTAEEVTKGKVWKSVDISLPVDWSCEAIDSRNFCLRLHALLFIDGVYKEYSETGDDCYKKLIMDYMLDWVEQNHVSEAENEWAWHDNATALRMYRMSYYYYLFGSDFDKKGREMIEESLRQQAKLLASEEFYTEKHNHGMHQDLGLLAYTLLISDDDIEKESYISTALARTGEYLDYVFTSDGIHKEHSPLYARDVLDSANIFNKLTKNISPEFTEKIANIEKMAEKYLVQIIKPNGKWPPLGDSSETSTEDMQVLESNCEYKYFISGGEEGTKPDDEAVFEEGGYAVMRSSWIDSVEEATWMMLCAATFSSTHKHGDDLSFLLYHKGDLFVEGGKRDYNYLEEQTAWAYSAYAHNILLVNGEGFPVKIGKSGFQSILPEALETGIVEYNFSENEKSVTAVQKRYENVEQYRTVRYDKHNNIAILEDRMDAAEDFTGTLLFHIAEGVTVEEEENGWNLYRDGELVAIVAVESENDLTLHTVTDGAGEYPYCTWIFNGNTKPAYGSLLMTDIACNVGENNITTTIYLK